MKIELHVKRSSTEGIYIFISAHFAQKYRKLTPPAVHLLYTTKNVLTDQFEWDGPNERYTPFSSSIFCFTFVTRLGAISGPSGNGRKLCALL